jgi:hypothetical protein
MVRACRNRWEEPIMAGERRIHSVEECYRLAAEARRMAEKQGVSPAEKADLLEVEAQWLSLARSRPNGSH